MPAGLRSWYREHAAATGQKLNALLVAALEEYRARHDGATAAPAPAASGTTAAPKRARKPRADTAPRATFREPESASDIAAAIFRRTNGDQQ
jgi:hypothetical protein